MSDASFRIRLRIRLQGSRQQGVCTMKRSLFVALAALVVAPAAAHAQGSLQVQVLSNRADVISAGAALVAVKLPAGVDASKVHVTNSGDDITDTFALRSDGRFEGL